LARLKWRILLKSVRLPLHRHLAAEKITTDGICMKLLMSLYGTMQGGSNWWMDLDIAYTVIDFKHAHANQSVCLHLIENGDHTEYSVACTYTDNVVGISSNNHAGESAQNDIGSQYKTTGSDANLVLGICLEINKEAGTIHLSQEAYINCILEHYNMSDTNPQCTPLAPGIDLNLTQSPAMPQDHSFIKDKLYREIVGAIMYLQIAICPDLSFAVNLLSAFNSNPGPTHWQVAKHLLCYIKATKYYGITYSCGHNTLKPIGFIDSDYTGDNPNTRQTLE
jgi:hypothetical protein